MAFIIPIIGAAIGLSTMATALLQIGAAVGLGFLAKSLAPKQTASAPSGARVNLRTETDPSRDVIFGETATAGTLAYWNLYGVDNDFLQMVVVLASHECDSLVSIQVDGNDVAWNASTGAVSDFTGSDGKVKHYGGKLYVRFHSGAPGQVADSDLVSHSAGRLGSNDKGTGLCYAVVQAKYSQSVFPGGIPKIVFRVRGAKLYDARLDTSVGGSGSQRWDDPSTWAYSGNPSVIVYNLLRGFRDQAGLHLIGLNAPVDAIGFADYAAAANACDESVMRVSGSSEPRYRAGFLAEAGRPNRQPIEDALLAMAGSLVHSGGIYRILAGVAQTPVATITDDDLVVAQAFVVDPCRPRSELVNTVNGSYTDPATSFSRAAIPPRSSATDIATDGLRLTQTMDLAPVTSPTQGQRILEIARRRARRQLVVSMTLRARWFVIEPGDWITLTSARRNLTGVVLEVQSARVKQDLTVEITAREIAASVYDWTVGDEVAITTSTDLDPGSPNIESVSGLSVATIVVLASGGSQRPGITASWTPITDPTVTHLRIEYRRVGDDTAIEVQALDAGAGTRTWIEGLQGGTTYEVRALPVTVPERATSWSPWVATTAATDPVVVDQAVIATEVPPGAITVDMLDAQSRLELSLATAVADVQGSVQQQIDVLSRLIQNAGEGAVSGIVLGADAKRQVRTLEDTAGALAARVTTTEEVQAGQGAAWTTRTEVISGTRYTTGLITVAADDEQSTIYMLANSFLFAQPGVTGGTPWQAFVIGENASGETRFVLNGDVFVPGSIHASALIANSITTLYISDPTGSYYYDFANGRDGSTDGLFTIDRKNRSMTVVSPAFTDFAYDFNAFWAFEI